MWVLSHPIIQVCFEYLYIKVLVLFFPLECLNRRASDGGANLHRFFRNVAGNSQTGSGSVEGLASVSIVQWNIIPARAPDKRD